MVRGNTGKPFAAGSNAPVTTGNIEAMMLEKGEVEVGRRLAQLQADVQVAQDVEMEEPITKASFHYAFCMYCGDTGDVVLCEGPQCHNVVCLVSKEHPRGCLVDPPPAADDFECPPCCYRQRKVFPWQLRKGASPIWTVRKQVLEPVLFILLRLEGMTELNTFGASVINLLAPKYSMLKHPDEQARFAMAEFQMQYLNPEYRGQRNVDYKNGLDEQCERIRSWLKQWENAPARKILIMFLTNSNWHHGTLQFVPRRTLHPNGWSASWKQILALYLGAELTASVISKRPGVVLATGGSVLKGEKLSELRNDVSNGTVEYILGFDTEKFVFNYHHLCMLRFLEAHLVLSLPPSTAREIAWSSAQDTLASTSVVLLERNAANMVEGTALVFGHPSHRPFGILPPPCTCGTSVVNWRVKKAKSIAPRFRCVLCKNRTPRFLQPAWSVSIENRPSVFLVPFPFIPWLDVALLPAGVIAST